MKKKTRLILFMILAVILSACGQTDSTQDFKSMSEGLQAVKPDNYAPVEAEHGEDYVIEWVDAGMEAHIRFILDRPEGDIYHSDVWDIQVFAIAPNSGTPHDIALTQPVEGYDVFDMDSIYLVSNDFHWFKYDGATFPAVESFADLRHFDSLQIFNGVFMARETVNMDISGIENCKYLKKITLSNVQLKSLEPFSQMLWLETLTLQSCGSLDLTPLENLPVLWDLGLEQCNLQSLEPLTTMPSLIYLKIGSEATYPSLEPLTRTNVTHLDIGLSMLGRDMYEDLDYKYLADIPNLFYLNLTNHSHVDAELCNYILEHNASLKYLDISYTQAANESEMINTENLEGFAVAKKVGMFG